MSDIVEEVLGRWVPNEHPDRYGNIGKDVKALCAEITRLREEVQDYKRWAAQVTVEANEEVSRLREKVERLRDMVSRAYRDGFGEGIKEHTTHKGGTPWHLSKWPTVLTQERGDDRVLFVPGSGDWTGEGEP